MAVNETRGIIFENYYKRIGFLRKAVIIQWNTWKKIIVDSKQINKTIPDPCNVKDDYESFIKKTIKSVKQPKIITYQPKTFENRNIADMKSIITEHIRTSHKLFNYSWLLDRIKK